MLDPYYNAAIPAHVAPESVHDFNVHAPSEENQDPYIAIHRLHQLNLPELFWTRNNGGHWIALSSEAISDAALDAASFSSKNPFVPDQYNTSTSFFVPLTSDPPDHAGYRAIVQPLFSPARVASLESGITAFTGELIDGLRARGGCEFMGDFALQMPVAVFLQLLDLPLGDRLKLLDIVLRFIRPPDGQSRDEVLQEVFDYLQPFIEERYGKQGEDVVSKLVNGRHRGRSLVLEEQLGLTATVFIGGMDSVASTLGFIAQYLAEHPEARVTLIENPARIPNAVDEFIRRFSVTMMGRQVTRDMDFHKVALRKGDHIILMGALHNLNDSRFPDSLTVDFNRKRGNHATFGTGIHVCLGAFLARLELRVFLTEWLKRIPEFRITPGSTLQHNLGPMRSLQELHLTWAKS